MLGRNSIFPFLGLLAAVLFAWCLHPIARNAQPRPAKASVAFSPNPAPCSSILIPALRHRGGLQLRDVLRLHQRRAACRRTIMHRSSAEYGLVRGHLGRLHGGKFHRRTMVVALRRRLHDPARRRRHGDRRGGRNRMGCAGAGRGAEVIMAPQMIIWLRRRLHAAELDRRVR